MTFPRATLEELEGLFDDYPSINASLQDFEDGNSEIEPSPRIGIGYPSQHSGFRSDTDSEMADLASEGRYSPPAWRRDVNGERSSGFWQNESTTLGKRHFDSRDSSPEYEDAQEEDTLAIAARTRLPTGSLSPEKRRSPSPERKTPERRNGKMSFTQSPAVVRTPITRAIKEESDDEVNLTAPESPNNYFRFSMKTELQHRTEVIESTLCYVRSIYNTIFRSRSSFATSILVILVATVAVRSLFSPGTPPPVPDLVKVASLARSFEPLIYYSENGVRHVADLQATGVAVWDLGETVRQTNMTSAPMIYNQLDDLSETLKTVAIEQTRFFANVDGDVDGILIVMDWARRELSQLQQGRPGAWASAYDNIYTLLNKVGAMETSTGTPTHLGEITTFIFGAPVSQRTSHTLQRTFQEFIATLEEAITSELDHALALFSLFEAIDRQFQNLARTVIREASAQDFSHDDMLSSLWTKILGPDAATLHKYEKNKELLANIRSKTVENKGYLQDHNTKLLAMKAALETLRRKLVSPLLRANGSTLGVEEQIRGLEDVAGHLGGVREMQKMKVMEMLYGAGSNSGRRHLGAIEGSWER